MYKPIEDTISKFDKEQSLRDRKKNILSQVDRLMKLLSARYTQSEDKKTILCELMVFNPLSQRMTVIATSTVLAMYVELQDIPRAQEAAYNKAATIARDFFTNMVVFWDAGRDDGKEFEIPFFGEKYFTMNFETPKEPEHVK